MGQEDWRVLPQQSEEGEEACLRARLKHCFLHVELYGEGEEEGMRDVIGSFTFPLSDEVLLDRLMGQQGIEFPLAPNVKPVYQVDFW